MAFLRFKVDQAQRLFFDNPRVSGAVSKARLRVLSKAGAFIRRTAKGLIRNGKKPSVPGQPPHNRVGALKDRIYFSYDPKARSVVVGPAKLNIVFFKGNGRPVAGTVPEVLEEGGKIGVLEWKLPGSGKWVRADLRSRRRLGERETRIRTVNIEARPYMAPAFAANRPKFPELWRNSIKTA